MTPTTSSFHASAPGSLMLMGEHAVLHGSHALCAAINQRMRLRLIPGADRTFQIQSALGEYEGELSDIEICKPFAFVLCAIQRAAPRQGFKLAVHSDFSATMGFGSSAAVTVATVTLLRALNGKAFDRAAIFNEALTVVRTVQGKASGSDVAAAVYGGAVLYRPDPLRLEPLAVRLPLSVCYAGYKTPTAEVIRLVEKRRQNCAQRFADLFHLMDQCVIDAAAALREGNLAGLGALFDLHHGLQAALGSSDETLDYLVHQLRKQSGVCGAKISGSGLGDCVIALGNPQAEVSGYEHFSVEIDPQGVQLDS